MVREAKGSQINVELSAAKLGKTVFVSKGLVTQQNSLYRKSIMYLQQKSVQNSAAGFLFCALDFAVDLDAD